MRFVDLAVAGVIAISSVALLMVWNPQTADMAYRRGADEAHLRDLLVKVIREEGLVQLSRQSPHEICSFLTTMSNATLVLSAVVDGVPCGNTPPPGAVSAELPVILGSRTVVLEAWYGA